MMNPVCLNQDGQWTTNSRRGEEDISLGHAQPRTFPFISIIVPVRNEEQFIRPMLRQLVNQDYPADHFEIIVVDGESTDETSDIVRELQHDHSNVHLIPNPRRWSSAGRNLGIRAAVGDLVVIIDGHCELRNTHYLTALAEAFDRSGADCIARPQPLDISGATSLQRAIAAARSSPLGHHPDSFIYSTAERFVPSKSVGAAYRKTVFDRVGYFDENFDACEDVEFNHRLDCAGLRCFFTPKVQVHYHPRSSLSRLFHQLHRYGQGRVRLLVKHPETFSLPGFLPAGFLIGMGLGAVAALVSSWLATAYLGVLILYASMVLLASLHIAGRNKDPRLIAWLPLVFPIIHLGAGSGILWEAVSQLIHGRSARTNRLSSIGGSRSQVNSQTKTASLSFFNYFQPWNGDHRRLDTTFRHPTFWHTPGNHLISSYSPEVKAAPLRPSRTILNALTVDVEDYYHVSAFESFVHRSQWREFESRVVANTHKILETLDIAGVQATFFVLGYVADCHPDLVREIQKAGHEIGCHSYWHRLVYRQTPEEFREDLRRARDSLQNITGNPVVAYRAPSFSITKRNLWALDILIEEGFRYDSSIYPTYHDRYGIAGAPCQPHYLTRPAGTIWEFPLAIYQKAGYPLPIGGGGYFRLYPYSFTRHGLRAINALGRPFAVYIHPWELDPNQPRFQPGRIKRFRHYVNLHRTEARLKQLLQDFSLGTVSEVHARLEDRGEMPQWNLSAAA